MTRSQLIRALITDAVVIAATVALSVVAIDLISWRMGAIRDSIAAKKQVAYSIQEEQANNAALKSAFDILGSADTQIADSFPPSDDISSFISAISAFGARHGVVQTFHLNTPTPAPIVMNGAGLPIFSVSYSLTVQAPSLTSTIAYLKDFESLQYFTGATDGITLSPIGTGNIQTDTITTGFNDILYVRSQH